MSSVTLSLALS